MKKKLETSNNMLKDIYEWIENDNIIIFHINNSFKYIYYNNNYEDLTNFESLIKEDLTKKDLTKEELKKEELIKEELRNKDLINEDLKNQELINEDLTTKDLTTQDLTSQELIDQDLTNEYLTNQDLTNQDLTNKRIKNLLLKLNNNYIIFIDFNNDKNLLNEYEYPYYLKKFKKLEKDYNTIKTFKNLDKLYYEIPNIYY